MCLQFFNSTIFYAIVSIILHKFLQFYNMLQLFTHTNNNRYSMHTNIASNTIKYVVTTTSILSRLTS